MNIIFFTCIFVIEQVYQNKLSTKATGPGCADWNRPPPSPSGPASRAGVSSSPAGTPRAPPAHHRPQAAGSGAGCTRWDRPVATGNAVTRRCRRAERGVGCAQAPPCRRHPVRTGEGSGGCREVPWPDDAEGAWRGFLSLARWPPGPSGRAQAWGGGRGTGEPFTRWGESLGTGWRGVGGAEGPFPREVRRMSGDGTARGEGCSDTRWWVEGHGWLGAEWGGGAQRSEKQGFMIVFALVSAVLKPGGQLTCTPPSPRLTARLPPAACPLAPAAAHTRP